MSSASETPLSNVEVKCCVHRENTINTEIPLQITNTRFNKLVACTNLWKDLDGNGKVIAVKLESELGLLEEAGKSYEDVMREHPYFGFHPNCYRRYIDKKAITLAEKRMARKRQENAKSNTNSLCTDNNVSLSVEEEYAAYIIETHDNMSSATEEVSLNVEVCAPCGIERHNDMPSASAEPFANVEVKCCVHLKNTFITEAPVQITNIRFNKLVMCTKLWKDLDGNGKVIAEKLASELGLLEEGKSCEDVMREHPHFGFHSLCYRRYIDKKRITSAENRMAKKERGKRIMETKSNGEPLSEVECCVHREGILTEAPIQITKTRFNRLVVCTKLWRRLDRKCKVIAEKLVFELRILRRSYEDVMREHPYFGFHPACYRRYIIDTSCIGVG